MISGFGGSAAADAYDFEATRWIPVYEGDYSVAKQLITRLETEHVPNRLTFPDGEFKPSVVVVQVMQRDSRRARDLITDL
jgi:hypothetical protein